MSNNIVTAELQISVVGEGDDSLSPYISRAVKAIDKMGVKYQVTPMGTALQAEGIEKILEVCLAAHKAVRDTGIKRVLTHITIDDRRKGKGMEEKVRSVQSKL